MIYEIAWEIIIPIIQPVTKTNYLLLWRYPVKFISVLNRSAKHYSLAMFKIQKRVLTFVLFRVSYNVSFQLNDQLTYYYAMDKTNKIKMSINALNVNQRNFSHP